MRVYVSEDIQRVPYMRNLFFGMKDHGIEIIRFRGFARFLFEIFKADIFHIHWIEKRARSSSLPKSILRTVFFMLILIFYRLIGKKIVITIHNINPHIRQNRLWDYMIFILSFKLANKLIIHSITSKARFDDVFPQFSSKLVVIPMGSTSENTVKVSLTKTEAKQHFKLNPNKIVIGMVGNIEEYKGVDLFCDVSEKMLNLIPNLQFFIAGRCTNQRLLNRLTLLNTKTPDFIFKAGFLENEDMQIAYEAIDLGIIPFQAITNSSSFESLLFHGIPTITSNLPSLVETGSNFAWYCEGRDVETWLNQIEFALSDDNLTKQRLKINENYKSPSWEVARSKTIKLYKDLAIN